MGIENRKYPRRDIELDVKVVVGDGAPIRCWLADISEGGARLATSQAGKLPDEFTLELSNELRRWCRIVWRADEEVGVQFTSGPDLSVERTRGSEKAHVPSESKIRHLVMVTCFRTGKAISTGIRVGSEDDLRKLSKVRSFTQCRHCKVVHSWTASDAWIPET
jgi:hypothetical protein